MSVYRVIPSYYIDYPTGVALLNNIYNLSHQPQQEGYSPSMVHVQLVPGKKPVLDHWQFGLVIVGIMLLTCILTVEQSLVDLLPTRTFKKKTSSVESLSHHCVICLDGFEQGHVLRRLPCQHEYHRDCIDTWLTRKNNTCPLCLQRIEIPTVPEQAHPTMPDLVQTWQHLEQASVRQYHSRSYSRP
ncbi:E3 ubiquitin-protein ligase rnf13 [Rhizopus stolonifer]|uniref:E3 ubiquitin-protein ligase rnf13 n=1 Tax=Rhizopus stolonifer TaxID=4846 RepID=A0A367KJM5_RHIST|nr:E3 ubiquitin-protein ligase rnf13 [Rhizopus stolonifer]